MCVWVSQFTAYELGMNSPDHTLQNCHDTVTLHVFTNAYIGELCI